ncbi:MAG: hypothetical protein IJJ30_03880 [Erysipelotrichaceae bacterium]|nr:hypothetical protein [Erysipelotrichaceae bacterium]MBR2551790.1 hypothetical protein [Erysipelotrichaceae bacterium]
MKLPIRLLMLSILLLLCPVNEKLVKADSFSGESSGTRYSVYTVSVDKYTTYNGVTAHIYGTYDVVNNSSVQNIQLHCTFSGGTGSCTFNAAGNQVCCIITFPGACTYLYV